MKGKKPKYLYVALSEEDIKYYGPQYLKDYDLALKQLKADIYATAKELGYSRKQIFTSSIDEAVKMLNMLWETKEVKNDGQRR